MGRGMAVLTGLLVVLVLLGVALWPGSEPDAGPRDAGSAHDPALTPDDTLVAHERTRGDVADELRPATSEVEPLATRGEAPPAATVDETVGLVVYGALVDKHGGRVQAEGMSVWLDGPDARRVWERTEDGTFAFAGLAPGSWTLGSTATGYEDHEQPLELGAHEPVLRVDVVMRGAVVLAVRLLTPDGGSLQDAVLDAAESRWHGVHLSVVATPERPSSDLPPIDHRAYSRYGMGEYSSRIEAYWLEDAMPSGSDGILQLDGPLPAWVSLVSRHVIVESQLVEPGAEEVVFVVPLERVQATLGGLRLRVVDATTGAPLPEARVELSTSQGSGAGRTVDEQGRVEFSDQLPGLLDLSVTADGHGRLMRVVELRAGEVLDLGDVPLDPATAVRGSIVDPQGQPVSAVFRLHPVERFAEDYSLLSRRSNRSDKNGQFEALGQRRALLVLRVTDEDWAGVQLVDTREGDVEDLRVTVHAPTLVILAGAWPAEQRLPVGLYDATGTPIVVSHAFQGGREWRVRLAPGEYQVVVGDAQPRTLTVGNQDFEFELQP